MRALAAHLGLAALVSPCLSVVVDDNTNLFQRVKRKEVKSLSEYASSSLMQATKWSVIEGLLVSMFEEKKTEVEATSLEVMHDRNFQAVEMPLKIKCEVNVDTITCRDDCAFEIAFGIPKETLGRLDKQLREEIYAMTKDKLAEALQADMQQELLNKAKLQEEKDQLREEVKKTLNEVKEKKQKREIKDMIVNAEKEQLETVKSNKEALDDEVAKNNAKLEAKLADRERLKKKRQELQRRLREVNDEGTAAWERAMGKLPDDASEEAKMKYNLNKDNHLMIKQIQTTVDADIKEQKDKLEARLAKRTNRAANAKPQTTPLMQPSLLQTGEDEPDLKRVEDIREELDEFMKSSGSDRVLDSAAVKEKKKFDKFYEERQKEFRDSFKPTKTDYTKMEGPLKDWSKKIEEKANVYGQALEPLDTEALERARKQLVKQKDNLKEAFDKALKDPKKSIEKSIDSVENKVEKNQAEIQTPGKSPTKLEDRVKVEVEKAQAKQTEAMKLTVDETEAKKLTEDERVRAVGKIADDQVGTVYKVGTTATEETSGLVTTEEGSVKPVFNKNGDLIGHLGTSKTKGGPTKPTVKVDGQFRAELSGDWGKKPKGKGYELMAGTFKKKAKPYPVSLKDWVRSNGKLVKKREVTEVNRKADSAKVNYLPDWYLDAAEYRKKVQPDDIPDWWWWNKPQTRLPWDPVTPTMRHDQQKKWLNHNLIHHVPESKRKEMKQFQMVYKGDESLGAEMHEMDMAMIDKREKMYYDSLAKEKRPWWHYIEIHPEMPTNEIDSQMRIAGSWCQIKSILRTFDKCDSKTRIPDGIDGALQAAIKLCERFGFEKQFATEFDKEYSCQTETGERPFRRVETVLQGDFTYLMKRGFMMIGPEYDIEDAIESGRNHYCNARRVLSEIEVPATVAGCGWMGKALMSNLSMLSSQKWGGYTPCHARDQKIRDCYKWAKAEDCTVAKSILQTVWPEKPNFYQYKSCPMFRTRDASYSVWAATNWRTMIRVKQGFCMEGSRVRVGKSDCCKALPMFLNQCILTQQFCHQRDYMDYCSSYVCIDVKGTSKTVLQEHAQHLVESGDAGYLHCGPCGQCSNLPDIQLWARHRHQMTGELHTFINSHRKVEWDAGARFEYISMFREMTRNNMGKVFTAGCIEAFLNTSMCEARLCPDACTGSIAEPLSSYSTTDWEGKGNVCVSCKMRCTAYLKQVGGWDRRMLGIHGWDSAEDQKQVCQHGIFTDKTAVQIEVMSLR